MHRTLTAVMSATMPGGGLTTAPLSQHLQAQRSGKVPVRLSRPTCRGGQQHGRQGREARVRVLARIGHGALLAFDGCEIRHKAADIAGPSRCRFTRSRPARPLLGTMTRPRAFAAFFALAVLLTGGAQPSKPLRAAWHPCRKRHGPNHVRCHLPPILLQPVRSSARTWARLLLSAPLCQSSAQAAACPPACHPGKSTKQQAAAL